MNYSGYVRSVCLAAFHMKHPPEPRPSPLSPCGTQLCLFVCHFVHVRSLSTSHCLLPQRFFKYNVCLETHTHTSPSLCLLITCYVDIYIYNILMTISLRPHYLFCFLLYYFFLLLVFFSLVFFF